MTRRDFLLFRREREERVVELSCQRLYMRCLDTQITGAEPTETGDAPDPWGHEPALVLEERTAAQIFEDISLTLEEADILRLVDARWIKGDELTRRLERVKVQFTARGGRVEIV